MWSGVCGVWVQVKLKGIDICGVTHHAGVVVGLLGGADQVEACQVGGEVLGAVNQHLFQARQIL